MRLLAATVSIVVLAAATVAAAAQPSAPAALDDARCLLAMVALSNVTDPNAQRFGQDGVVFFTGRIAARDPGFDFARLKSMANTLDPKAAETDLQQRCGPMFQKSMQQVETALAPPAGGAAPSASPPK